MMSLYFVEIMLCLEEKISVLWYENKLFFKEEITYVLEGDSHVYEGIIKKML